MWLRPDWPAPSNVVALSTCRYGGVSSGDYRGLNLGMHVEDDAAAVVANRRLLQQQLPTGAHVQWLEQVHGTAVVQLPLSAPASVPTADASFTQAANQFCCVMTADCLPLLLCNRAGTQVAAVHAGWRGLQAGIIEQTVQQFSTDVADVLVWLGPAIGPSCFEVGAEVRQAFIEHSTSAESAFTPSGERYLADIYQLARQRLAQSGIRHIYGGEHCTVSDPSRFYSFRRNGTTGRQATLIGINSNA
ncbi:peptidoglycan editing factor PgeF [Ferrimonas lipolytica]|uniref:Purine nucleoside phosphorylase n=1 Tax=Ferrimonas lipolytica TaxID=2724191 RepID=A0A6H1U9Y7_9GAMM|nr:peptidoglycan editing factor PgeF [Ferrimonas lipolytica]QIZ75439.1 peptidoglycan editing factor PgeF [Ferrimonas lipolytica]